MKLVRTSNKQNLTHRGFPAAALCLVLSLFLATPAFAQSDETRHYFKDWLAACRSNGYCSATAYDNPGTDGRVADNVLRIGRHPNGRGWEISFSGVKTLPDSWEDVSFAVDGQSFTLQSPHGFGAYDAVNDFYVTDETIAQPLLDALIAGTQASVSFTGNDGSAQTAPFSLSGLSAALLWIDEQQDMLDAPRTASAQPYGLTPVSPGSSSILPAELIERHRANPDCEAFEDLPHGSDIITGPLDDEQTLYLLPCTAGAYNFAYIAYRGDEYSFEHLYFTSYSDAFGWSGTPYLVNPGYDAQTRELTEFNKGRGIADCGTSGLWQWQDYGFKLLEYRSKSKCDETGEPGDFPVVYRADGYTPPPSEDN